DYGGPPVGITDPERRVRQRRGPIAADVDRLARILPAMAVVVAHHAVAKRRLRRLLLGAVIGGADPEAARIDSVAPLLGALAVTGDQLAPQLLHEIAADIMDALARAGDGAERRRLRRRPLLGGDEAVLLHLAEHPVAPRQ